jgi:hypothetical protein
MLRSIHFLLTYVCNFECDHCFLFSGPRAGGTFGIEQLRAALRGAADIGSIESVFFEGGEPMLYFPLLAEGIRCARRLGLKTGIVTNAYWATSTEDALLWLKALQEAGLDSLTISDDALHFGNDAGAHAARVEAAAKRLGLQADVICKERPRVSESTPPGGVPSLVSGGIKFRGRAARKLVSGLPLRPWEQLTSCPFENLADPERVHADCFGNLHLCQGLSMGNYQRRSMKEVAAGYDPAAHPIAGPLIRGGPAELARSFGVGHGEGYADECHMCFEVRLSLLRRFPELLCPPQVYGAEIPDPR